MIKMFEEFIKEIKEFNPSQIYFLCSGGYDSTFMLLNLYNKFPTIPKFILFNNTFLEFKKCQDLVYLLSFLTGFKVVESKPENINMKEIMEKSFNNLEYGKTLVKNGRYSKRTAFTCCYYLKEKPARKIFKTLPKKSIAFSGIKKADSKNRGIFLTQLEKKKTYIHYNSKMKCWYGYPLRNIKDIDVNSFIHKIPYPVEHSACKICPIVLLFNIIKSKNYADSRQYYFNLTGKKWNNQMLITDYSCFWDNTNII